MNGECHSYPVDVVWWLSCDCPIEDGIKRQSGTIVLGELNETVMDG